MNMLNNPMESFPAGDENNEEEIFEVKLPENLDMSAEDKDDISRRVVAEHPYLKKVVGVGENEEFVLSELDRLEKEGLEKLPKEHEKTEKEIELIGFAKKAADEILSEFGGEDLYDIPLERIHVVEFDNNSHGNWNCDKNSAVLSKLDSSVKFAIAAFHELVHSKSYNALQLLDNENDKRLYHYRNGLTVFSRDGKNKYMESLNESVLYELEKIFFDRYIRNNDSFPEEEKDQEIASAKRGPGNEYVGTEANRDLAEKMRFFSQKLADGIKGDDAYSEYNSPKDIMNLMIRSSISGNILKLSRMIGGYLGGLKN